MDGQETRSLESELSMVKPANPRDDELSLSLVKTLSTRSIDPLEHIHSYRCPKQEKNKKMTKQLGLSISKHTYSSLLLLLLSLRRELSTVLINYYFSF